MVGILVAFGMLVAFGGVVLSAQVGFGPSLVGGACFVGILARIVQADRQHTQVRERLKYICDLLHWWSEQ